MSIGQRIKAMRKQQGLSIDELAYRLGKNRTTLYRYENGDIENLPLGILDSLANALNTTPAYLMGWDDRTSKDCVSNPACNSIEARHVLKWIDEFGANMLSEEECIKVIEYTKFLLSMRDK